LIDGSSIKKASVSVFLVGVHAEKREHRWRRLETFKIIFDDRYVARCNWSWGKEATWSMQAPPAAKRPAINGNARWTNVFGYKPRWIEASFHRQHIINRFSRTRPAGNGRRPP